MSLLLGVNIDHVATLRQARYALMPDSPNAEPSPLEAALDAKDGGADSITLHVRGDRRHVQEADALAIQEHCGLPVNLEMADAPGMLELALRLRPAFACLVPEHRREITTEGGLDCVGLHKSLQRTVAELRGAGIRVSLFIDPDMMQVAAAAQLGAEMIELHTGCFANASGADRGREVERLAVASRDGRAAGLQVNAGHGINYQNVKELFAVPHLTEFNIGHTIVARSVRVGMTQAVREMRAAMEGYPG